MGALLGDVVARRVPVSVFWRYRVSLRRKKRCQQIIDGGNTRTGMSLLTTESQKCDNLGVCTSICVRQHLSD